jgi:3-phytase
VAWPGSRAVAAILLLLGAPGCSRQQSLPAVAPSVETAPVRSSGDAADDPAVWVHPTDPTRSLVVGTDRRAGLGVWDLMGREVQFLTATPTDNVDLRELGGPGGPRSVVVASGWDDRVLHLYTADPSSGRLTEAATVRTGVAAAGLCLYRNEASGRVYAFAMSEEGVVEQWELHDDGRRIGGTRVRGPWEVGGETEGCVADDEQGHLYIGEEGRAVWRYDASPDAPTSRRTRVDDVESGHLVADIEGLALSHGPGGSGFLFVSSQGDNAFTAYRRGGTNEFAGRFRILPDEEGGDLDGCEDTDGIEVVSSPLGPSFPAGLFVCQDGVNGKDHQNFKLVGLDRVVELLRPPSP